MLAPSSPAASEPNSLVGKRKPIRERFCRLAFRGAPYKIYQLLSKHRGPSVLGLLCYSRPFAILWGVISVIVNSIYRLTGGGFAHIRKETLEAIRPFGTHANTTRSIFIISRARRAFASILHGFPYPIGATEHGSNSMAVRLKPCGREFAVKASAGLCDTRNKPMPSESPAFPAITPAYPVMVTASFAIVGTNRNAAKSLCYQVFHSSTVSQYGRVSTFIDGRVS